MPDALTIARSCIATNARRASRALTRRYDRALAGHDLRITQFAVLVAAKLAQDDMTLTDIAEMLGLERSSLSRNLQPLERRGLVTLGPERQHRARQLSLTIQGERLLEAAKADWANVQAESRALLGEDLETATKALQRLATLT